jgi:hypothetical protein
MISAAVWWILSSRRRITSARARESERADEWVREMREEGKWALATPQQHPSTPSTLSSREGGRSHTIHLSEASLRCRRLACRSSARGDLGRLRRLSGRFPRRLPRHLCCFLRLRRRSFSCRRAHGSSGRSAQRAPRGLGHQRLILRQHTRRGARARDWPPPPPLRAPRRSCRLGRRSRRVRPLRTARHPHGVVPPRLAHVGVVRAQWWLAPPWGGGATASIRQREHGGWLPDSTELGGPVTCLVEVGPLILLGDAQRPQLQVSRRVLGAPPGLGILERAPFTILRIARRRFSCSLRTASTPNTTHHRLTSCVGVCGGYGLYDYCRVVCVTPCVHPQPHRTASTSAGTSTEPLWSRTASLKHVVRTTSMRRCSRASFCGAYREQRELKEVGEPGAPLLMRRIAHGHGARYAIHHARTLSMRAVQPQGPPRGLSYR